MAKILPVCGHAEGDRVLKPLRIHWRLLQGGEQAATTRARSESLAQTGLPDPGPQIEFCRRAEAAGMDGLLTDFGAAKPDPIVLATALGVATDRVEFIVAYRSGASCPTTFAQQINTLSSLVNGRVSLNIVAGHSPREHGYYGDFLPHDERYARTEEFLAICHGLWHGDVPVDYVGRYYRVANAVLNTPFVSPFRRHPEIFIAGGSDAARDLAIRQGTCWMRLGDTPERVAESIEPVLAADKEAGLRMSVVCRATRAQAVDAAHALVEGETPSLGERKAEQKFVRASDSVSMAATYALAEEEWLTPWLWTGAIRSHGAPGLAVVGSPEDVVEALLEYRRIGVSQFILSGWPKQEEMDRFGRDVMPLLRERERGSGGNGFAPERARPHSPASGPSSISRGGDGSRS